MSDKLQGIIWRKEHLPSMFIGEIDQAERYEGGQGDKGIESLEPQVA